MKSVIDKRKSLMQTGVFKTQKDIIIYLLARLIKENEGPVGSWTLKANLDEMGIECSTATVGRYLKNLDSKGYTLQRSNQGRILTPTGIDWLKDMDERLARAKMRNETTKAMQVNEYAELVDLLRTRKAIEMEATRSAALYATEEEIASLRKSIVVYHRYVAEKRDPVDPALDFHSRLAVISHNKFIKALLDILIFEEKQIEASMESLLTRERGGVYVVHHENIADAIEARDAEKAARLMGEHMDEILSAVEEQIEGIKKHNLSLKKAMK